MSPLEITTLLRLYSHADPFHGIPQVQRSAPAMRCTFDRFERLQLLAEGVNYMTVRAGASQWPYLSEKGDQLVKRLCEVQP